MYEKRNVRKKYKKRQVLYFFYTYLIEKTGKLWYNSINDKNHRRGSIEMRNYAITTDSNSDLSKEYIDKNHIGVIPCFYEIDNIVYGEKVCLKPNDFYKKMQEGSIPKTQSCNIEKIKQIFREYLREGLDILHISTTQCFNTGFENLKQAVNELQIEFPEATIIVLDSATISVGLASMIMRAVAMKNNGKTMEEIQACIEKRRTGFWSVVFLSDLQYLSKLGLLQEKELRLRQFVKMYPVIVINEKGFCYKIKDMRNSRKAFIKMIKIMEHRLGTMREEVLPFCVLHGNVPERAKEVSAYLTRRYPNSSVVIQNANPELASKLGRGMLGICLMGEYHDNIGEQYEQVSSEKGGQHRVSKYNSFE